MFLEDKHISSFKLTVTMPTVFPCYETVILTLSPVLQNLPARVVAIDGCDGVGKTTLGRYLAWYFNVSLIETDLFLVPNQGYPSYRDDEISRVINSRLIKPRPVIVEGVCILKLLQRLKVTPDFLIYVQSSSGSGSEALSKEIMDYEKTFVPKTIANIVVTLEHSANGTLPFISSPPHTIP